MWHARNIKEIYRWFWGEEKPEGNITLGRPGDKSTIYIRVSFYRLYCDYFIWCVSCTVVVLTYFVMCGYFDNCVRVLVICVLVFTVFHIVCTVFCIVSFMYIYSYLFYLYWCKDYCHRVTTQLQ